MEDQQHIDWSGMWFDNVLAEKKNVLTCRAVVSYSDEVDMLYILPSWVKPEMTPWSTPGPPNFISCDCKRKLTCYPYVFIILIFMRDEHHNSLGIIFLVHKQDMTVEVIVPRNRRKSFFNHFLRETIMKNTKINHNKRCSKGLNEKNM